MGLRVVKAMYERGWDCYFIWIIQQLGFPFGNISTHVFRNSHFNKEDRLLFEASHWHWDLHFLEILLICIVNAHCVPTHIQGWSHTVENKHKSLSTRSGEEQEESRNTMGWIAWQVGNEVYPRTMSRSGGQRNSLQDKLIWWVNWEDMT